MTHVPNMNLKFFHIAELLHNSLVAMVIVFPWQLGKPLIHIVTKNKSVNMNLKYFHIAELKQNYLIAMVTVFSYQPGRW